MQRRSATLSVTSRSSITRTAARSRGPKTGSKKSPKPTRCSPIQRSAGRMTPEASLASPASPPRICLGALTSRTCLADLVSTSEALISAVGSSIASAVGLDRGRAGMLRWSLMCPSKWFCGAASGRWMSGIPNSARSVAVVAPRLERRPASATHAAEPASTSRLGGTPMSPSGKLPRALRVADKASSSTNRVGHAAASAKSRKTRG